MSRAVRAPGFGLKVGAHMCPNLIHIPVHESPLTGKFGVPPFERYDVASSSTGNQDQVGLRSKDEHTSKNDVDQEGSPPPQNLPRGWTAPRGSAPFIVHLFLRSLCFWKRHFRRRRRSIEEVLRPARAQGLRTEVTQDFS